MTGRWFARPEGELWALRKPPCLASWNKSTDPDQIRLREYLKDTEDLLASSLVTGPWSLRLDVGLPHGRDLVDSADLDNYAYPLASHLRNEQLVSVWCTKRHAESSHVLVAPAREVPAPEATFSVRTTASSQAKAFKEQVRSAVSEAAEITGAAVKLQVSFTVSPRRNWLNLWKPTIDALDPLLGRTHDSRDWHPKDGRIVDLGLHMASDEALGNDVLVWIAASPTG